MFGLAPDWKRFKPLPGQIPLTVQIPNCEVVVRKPRWYKQRGHCGVQSVGISLSLCVYDAMHVSWRQHYFCRREIWALRLGGKGPQLLVCLLYVCSIKNPSSLTKWEDAQGPIHPVVPTVFTQAPTREIWRLLHFCFKLSSVLVLLCFFLNFFFFFQ